MASVAPVEVRSLSPLPVPQAGGRLCALGQDFTSGDGFGRVQSTIVLDAVDAMTNCATLASSVCCDAPAGFGRREVFVRTVNNGGGTMLSPPRGGPPPKTLIYAEPEVQSISASTTGDAGGLLQSGGIRLTLAGTSLFGRTDLGRDVSANVSIRVGADECSGVETTADGRALHCYTPAGTGGPYNVTVSAGGTATIAGATLSYEGGIVERITPAAVLQTLFGTHSVEIMGQRLGRRRQDISRVVIGGRECISVHWHNASSLVCTLPGSGLTGSGVTVFHGSVPSSGAVSCFQRHVLLS